MGYYPWIGSSYFNEPIRYLLLGDSHHRYGEAPAGPPMTESDRLLTIKLTEENISGKWRHAFWAKSGSLMSAFAGWSKVGETVPCDRVFPRIAFYNFCVESVSGHRDWPTADVVRESRVYFRSKLDELRPNFVIALGLARMNWYLSNLGPGFDISHGRKRSVVGRFGSTVILSTFHPMGRFSYRNAIDLLNEGKVRLGT